MSLIKKDPLQKRLEISNWIILGLFAGISVFISNKFALGILLGGLISIANFHWLYRGLRHVFKNLTGSAKTSVMCRFYLRFAITAVILYFIVSEALVNVIGLIIGLSIVVINIIFTTIVTLMRNNTLRRLV